MAEDKVLVVGAGAQAKYVTDILSFYPEKKAIGVVGVENNPKIHGKEIHGIEILGDFESVIPKIDKQVKIILAYSDNKKKEQLDFVNAIHPKAVVSGSAKVGAGTIINANATIMPFAKIGNHVMIHSNVVIEHDNVLEDFVNLAPGVTLAGYVKVRKGAYVHTGASVIPDITVGTYSIIGAGATVIEDVPDVITVAGNPAEILDEQM